MEPHRSISNSIVKRYSGNDTKRGAFWENNTMSKFSDIYKVRYILYRVYRVIIDITCNVSSVEMLFELPNRVL